jgi:PBSX family phage terminase large subunit
MDINKLDEEGRANLQAYLQYLVMGGLTDEQIEFFVRAEYVPNKSQMEFHRACNDCKEGGVKEILIEGPKGGGKSHATLIQAAYDCEKYPGIVCLFFRKQKTSAKEHLIELSTKTFRNIKHTVQKNEIIFPNGSIIRIAGYNSSNDILKYNGQQFSLFIYDELTMIKENDYMDMFAQLRKSEHGYYPRVYATTNPGGVGHNWVKKKFVEVRKAGTETTTRCIHSATEDNTTLGDYKSSTLMKLTGSKRERWLLGNWDINEGAAFNFTVQKNCCESGGAGFFKMGEQYGNRRVVIDSNWIRVGGIDFGSRKPYAFVWCAINQGMGRVYVYREDYSAGLSTKQQANRIIQKTGEDEELAVTFCDPAMARQYENDPSTNAIDEYSKYGVFLTQGSRQRKAGKWKIDNLLELKPDGMPGLIINPACKNLINQLDSLTYSDTDIEDVDTSEEDHAYDALRYALSRFREPVAYEDADAHHFGEADDEQEVSHFTAMQSLFE